MLWGNCAVCGRKGTRGRDLYGDGYGVQCAAFPIEAYCREQGHLVTNSPESCRGDSLASAPECGHAGRNTATCGSRGAGHEIARAGMELLDGHVRDCLRGVARGFFCDCRI